MENRFRDLLVRLTKEGHTPTTTAQAAAALYVGDGLREIAQAIRETTHTPSVQEVLAGVFGTIEDGEGAT